MHNMNTCTFNALEYYTQQVCNNWSERRCADGFVERAVGHYFWYFSTLVLLVVVVTTVAKLA